MKPRFILDDEEDDGPQHCELCGWRLRRGETQIGHEYSGRCVARGGKIEVPAPTVEKFFDPTDVILGEHLPEEPEAEVITLTRLLAQHVPRKPGRPAKRSNECLGFATCGNGTRSGYVKGCGGPECRTAENAVAAVRRQTAAYKAYQRKYQQTYVAPAREA